MTSWIFQNGHTIHNWGISPYLPWFFTQLSLNIIAQKTINWGFFHLKWVFLLFSHGKEIEFTTIKHCRVLFPAQTTEHQGPGTKEIRDHFYSDPNNNQGITDGPQSGNKASQKAQERDTVNEQEP